MAIPRIKELIESMEGGSGILPTPEEIGAVPITRTVNDKELSADIELSAEDIRAIGLDDITTSVSESSTNEQYPSAKAVYDYVESALEDTAAEIPITSTPEEDVQIWIDPDDESDDNFYTKDEVDDLIADLTPESIGAVKKTGDKMTGNLIIEKAGAPALQGINTTTGRDVYVVSTSDNYATIANRIAGDQNNRIALWLAPETEADDRLLRIHKVVDSIGNTYKVYHEGNKPSPAAIGAATKALYTGSLVAANWTANGTTGYKQTLTVTGVTASDTPVISIVLTGTAATDQTLLDGWNLVSRITTEANSVTAYCYGERPTVALPLQILCVR